MSLIAATKPAAPSAVSFPELLNLAGQTRDTRSYAIDLGVDETALIRFANGAVCDEEHRYLSGVIAKNRWALEFVSSHVKNARRGQPNRSAA